MCWASQGAVAVKNPPANAGDTRDPDSIPGWGRSPGEGNGNPLQCYLPGKSHGQRNLVDCSPWGHKESDKTERLHFHFLALKNNKDPGSQSRYKHDSIVKLFRALKPPTAEYVNIPHSRLDCSLITSKISSRGHLRPK